MYALLCWTLGHLSDISIRSDLDYWQGKGNTVQAVSRVTVELRW